MDGGEKFYTFARALHTETLPSIPEKDHCQVLLEPYTLEKRLFVRK